MQIRVKFKVWVGINGVCSCMRFWVTTGSLVGTGTFSAWDCLWCSGCLAFLTFTYSMEVTSPCNNQQQPHGFPTLSWEQLNPTGNPKGAPCSGREQSPPPWAQATWMTQAGGSSREGVWARITKTLSPFKSSDPRGHRLQSQTDLCMTCPDSHSQGGCARAAQASPSFRFLMCRKRASTLPSRACGRQVCYRAEHRVLQGSTCFHTSAFISLAQGFVWGAQKSHSLFKQAPWLLGSVLAQTEKANLTGPEIWLVCVMTGFKCPMTSVWSSHGVNRTDISFPLFSREAGQGNSYKQ